jgi:hypothetical protein
MRGAVPRPRADGSCRLECQTRAVPQRKQQDPRRGRDDATARTPGGACARPRPSARAFPRSSAPNAQPHDLLASRTHGRCQKRTPVAEPCGLSGFSGLGSRALSSGPGPGPSRPPTGRSAAARTCGLRAGCTAAQPSRQPAGSPDWHRSAGAQIAGSSCLPQRRHIGLIGRCLHGLAELLADLFASAAADHPPPLGN